MEEEVYNVIIMSETKINERITHEYVTNMLISKHHSLEDINSGIGILLEDGIIKRADDEKYTFKRYK